MYKIFTDEEFLLAISSSKSHSEAMKKLGYKGNTTKNNSYALFLDRLKPDLSHFGNFTEQEFLDSVKSSFSHKEAGYKLGYKSKCSIGSNSRYGRLFRKLKPETSHFFENSGQKIIKYNIPYKYNSKEYKKEYNKIRSKRDLKYKLSQNLRGRFGMAIKKQSKTGSAVQDLGCSIEKFKLWLEMLWTDGMSWENYGEWVIDHVKPLDSFDLTDRNQLLEACHFTNLQPLWEYENANKSNKILENHSFYSKI